jgi:hypothetical protein
MIPIPVLCEILSEPGLNLLDIPLYSIRHLIKRNTQDMHFAIANGGVGYPFREVGLGETVRRG